jgi:hypothetical protein
MNGDLASHILSRLDRLDEIAERLSALEAMTRSHFDEDQRRVHRFRWIWPFAVMLFSSLVSVAALAHSMLAR